MTRALLIAAALTAAGCMTAPAVTPGMQLRRETRQECVAHCQALGMRLSAVVLVRNAAGCVCSEPGAVSAVEGGGSAVNAGAYLVALEEEDERRRADEDDSRQRRMQQGSGAPAHGTPGSPGWHP